MYACPNRLGLGFERDLAGDRTDDGASVRTREQSVKRVSHVGWKCSGSSPPMKLEDGQSAASS
jgi:hypothetical protein